MTEWIPCKERMPENNKRVLVTILQKGYDGDHDSYFVEAATYFNKEFIGSEMNDLELFDEVIAWMPCIEPYKEERGRMSKCYIGDAMVLLYEEYKRAKDIEWVNKPISYALYNTWKFFDNKEKSRNRRKDKEVEE